MKFQGLRRAVWTLSLPIVFAEISETVIHVTDTIFLARVGLVELGAVAIGDTILDLALVLPLAIVDGVQILTARRLGQRRLREVGTIFNQGLVLVVALALALTFLVKFGSSWLVPLVVESERVAVAVDSFLQIGALGLVFAAAAFVYSALLVSLQRTRILIPATILLAVTNLALDWVLIFGKLGFPALGIRGAAWGSVGAEVLTFAFLTAYLLRSVSARRYGLFRLRGWNRRVSGLLLRVSTPVAGEGFLESLRWVVFFLILERVSTLTLGIANLVYACYEVFRIPLEGFSEATCSMVGRLVGSRQTGRFARLLGEASVAAAIVTLPLLLVALLAPEWVLSIFTEDEAILAQSVGSLRVVAIAMLVVIPAEMWLAAVVGTGDTSASLGIELVLTIVMLGAAYVAAIPLAGNLASIWLSLPLAWLAGLGLASAWLHGEHWRRFEI